MPTPRSTYPQDVSAGARLSPTRTRATWKPRIGDEDVPLFTCATCGRTYVGLGSAPAQIMTDQWRSVIMQPPYAQVGQPTCCGQPVQPTTLRSTRATAVGYTIDFLGGMDNNRLVLSWTAEASEPRCIVVKTLTGIMQRLLSPCETAQRHAVFALADEDAYCYCDLDPCEHCVANCKRGFVIYALCEDGESLRLTCGRQL